MSETYVDCDDVERCVKCDHACGMHEQICLGQERGWTQCTCGLSGDMLLNNDDVIYDAIGNADLTNNRSILTYPWVSTEAWARQQRRILKDIGIAYDRDSPVTGRQRK